MPHLFVTRPRLHDLLAGDQERARHFRWETINAIVSDIPQVERPAAHIVAVLRSDQASCTRRANVWAPGAQDEPDFWSQRRGLHSFRSDRHMFGQPYRAAFPQILMLTSSCRNRW